jgi:hypothetical protein
MLYILKFDYQYDRSFRMNVTDQLARLKVKEVFNDSAKRPFLFVYPDTKLLEVTAFLAIGPEIYVDGVVVVTEESAAAASPVVVLQVLQVPLWELDLVVPVVRLIEGH